VLARAENGAELELSGQTPRIIYGQLDAPNSLTLTRNASEDKLVCSGEFEAADLRIVGTSTTVADLIREVAFLSSRVSQLSRVMTMLEPPCYCHSCGLNETTLEPAVCPPSTNQCSTSSFGFMGCMMRTNHSQSFDEWTWFGGQTSSFVSSEGYATLCGSHGDDRSCNENNYLWRNNFFAVMRRGSYDHDHWGWSWASDALGSIAPSLDMCIESLPCVDYPSEHCGKRLNETHSIVAVYNRTQRCYSNLEDGYCACARNERSWL